MQIGKYYIRNGGVIQIALCLHQEKILEPTKALIQSDRMNCEQASAVLPIQNNGKIFRAVHSLLDRSVFTILIGIT